MEISTANIINDLTIVVEIKTDKQVIWRLKAFKILMHFAAWIGGFGGIEFHEKETV